MTSHTTCATCGEAIHSTDNGRGKIGWYHDALLATWECPAAEVRPAS
jgi:hypothetical protein